jgi:hypothetical protein
MPGTPRPQGAGQGPGWGAGPRHAGPRQPDPRPVDPGRAGHRNAGWAGDETGNADGEHVITPTSIYAPGSLVTPPDGDEGAGPEPPPRDGQPAGYQPGYRTAPGYGAAPGHGAGPGYGSGPDQGAGQSGRWGNGYGARPDYSAGPGRGTPPGYAAGPGSYPGPEAYRPGQAPQRGYAGPGYGYGANPGHGGHPRRDAGPAHGAAGAAGYYPGERPGHDQRPGAHGYSPVAPPGPAPAAGQGAYPGAAPYHAPGGRQEHGGHPAANGYPGQSGYPGPNGYAEPGWYASEDGYDGAGGYGGPVNGGGYAYVIRDEEPAQAPPGPRAPERAPSPEPQSRQSQQNRQNQQNQQMFPPGQAGEQPTADPAFAYGPDDPAYGPPSPEWYARREDTDQQAAAEERRQARGPFEPPPRSPRSGRETADATGGYPAASYLAVGHEALGLAGTDDDELGGRGGALDKIKDFYAAAEAIGAEHFDEHFERLLERQRKLISDYFREPASRHPADPDGERGSGYPGSGAEGPRRPDSGHLSFGAGQRSPR